MNIVIAGSSGFIGSCLTRFFEERNNQLKLLSRTPAAVNSYYWNPEKQELDISVLEGADVVINLCGESIFGRWSDKKKESIRKSRILPTQVLCDAILNLKVPPKLYIQASAIGYYGDCPHQIVDESHPAGHDFLAEVCKEWESVSSILVEKVRVAYCRFGIVLGKGGGALKYIEKAFSMGFGGPLGNGQQIMSWIAVDDVAGAIQHIIDHSEIQGAVNFTAPEALSNKEFTQTVGKILNKPTLLQAPKFALNMVFGEGAQTFLHSIHAQPKVLEQTNYTFLYPTLSSALQYYL